MYVFFSSVPPNIDDSLSSSDIIVREGSNVTLKCRATGSPTPTVKWKRDDNSKIAINKSLNGMYLCSIENENRVKLTGWEELRALVFKI